MLQSARGPNHNHRRGSGPTVWCFGNFFKEDTLEFMRRTTARSGLGDSTYLPEGFFKDPPDTSMEYARREMEMAMFGAVDELLANTKVRSRDVGIVVVIELLYFLCGAFSF